MFDGGDSQEFGDRNKYVTNGTGWTGALGEAAKKMWIEGRSASEIMRALSTPEHKLTRNAVISYIHRALPQGTKRATVAPPAMGRRFAWTPERRRKAAALKAEGRTPTEIAAAINDGLDDGERASVHSVRALLQREAERGDAPEAYGVWSLAAQKAIGELWQAGHSDGQIAVLISGKYDGGRELTRNAVKGIAERAGYRRPADMIRVRAPRTAPVKPFDMRKSVMVGGPVKPAAPATPFDYVAPPEPIPSLNVTFFARGARCCGFVTGENEAGEALYCGLPVDGSTRQKLYCSGHHGQMHRPLPPRGQRVRAPSDTLPLPRVRRGDSGILSRWG